VTTAHLRHQDTSDTYKSYYIGLDEKRVVFEAKRNWNTYSMLSEKSKAVFKSMLKGGCPYSSIVKLFNLSSEQVVSSKRKDLCLPPRIIGLSPILIKERREIAVYLYKQGVSLSDVAKEINLSEGYTYKLLKKSGIRRPSNARFS